MHGDDDSGQKTEETKGNPLFPKTTNSMWEDVRNAADKDAERGRAALERLAERYYEPIVGFFQRQNTANYLRNLGSTEDARDLAHGFISSNLYQRGILGSYTRQNTKFRSFLIECLKGFIHDKVVALKTLKRGQGKPPASIDAPQDEGGVGEQPGSGPAMQQDMDFEFAKSVANRAFQALESEEKKKGNHERFLALRGLILSGSDQISYQGLADRLGTSDGNVKVILHRYRARWADYFQREVCDTTDGDEVSEEMRYLIGLLAKEPSS